MSITLNISKATAATSAKIRKNVKQTDNRRLSKKSMKSNSKTNEFSFEFTENDKVKAVVARRRIKNCLNEKKINEKQMPTEHNFMIKESKNLAESSKSDNLLLNVINKPPSVVEKKPKLSRDERINSKKKKFNQNSVKILTQEEIDHGLKKFDSSQPMKKNVQKKTNIKKVNLFEKNMETQLVGQRLVKPLIEKIFTENSLESLDLHPHCVKNLKDLLNISHLTTVQQKTIPYALMGRDLLVRSQTGSGKTLAYALPCVEKLQKIRPKITRTCGINILIIVPTRELATQTYDLFLKLLKPYVWIVPGIITGGEKRKVEKARLRKGINILIGTPGRLVDHLLHSESFKLDKLEMLILDEADRLLEMGYERDVKSIVEGIGKHKTGKFLKSIDGENPFRSETAQPEVDSNTLSGLQTMLLSATLTSAVKNLAGLALKEPLFIDNTEDKPIQQNNFEESVEDAVAESKLVIPESLQLSYILVPPKLRLIILSSLLAKEFQKKIKAIVFMSTTEMVNFHSDLLNEVLTQRILDDEDEPQSDEDNDPLLNGVRIFKLSGAMSQQERVGVFKAFRDCKSGVLITTDVVGRGIDVPEVDLVVQYSPPQKISDFVHRVGRTGRMGKSGRAVLFLAPSEVQFIRNLEEKRIRISQIVLESYLEILLKYDSEANTSQEAASNLQHKFEESIEDDKEMKDKACKAYVSWIRFYSTFPKELKSVFNVKAAHLGHFAKSFGLRDCPTNFASKHSSPKELLPNNRLTYTARNTNHPSKPDKNATSGRKSNFNQNVGFNRMKTFSKKSLALSTSEYDSGIPSKKRKK